MTTNAIYTNPTGWQVREFSHSQYQTYKQCGKKFYFERVLGWRRIDGAAMLFGRAGETSVKYMFLEKRDPVETFELEWARFREKENLSYPKDTSWATYQEAGVGLMKKFRATWQSFPPRNPVFYDYKTSALKVKDERTGVEYQTIPDMSDSDSHGTFIVDMKCMNALINEGTPGLVINDPQLRTQAAVFYKYHADKTYRVALWNFCTEPKRMNKANADEIRANVSLLDTNGLTDAFALYLAHECNGLTYEEAGTFLGIASSKEAMKPLASQTRKGKNQNIELVAKLDAVVASINEAHKPEYVIQWVEGTMTKEHAEEALAEELSVVSLIQQEYFPRVGGVRFPNNQCTWCSHRGLCMEELYGAREEYSKITADELVRFEESALSELD